MKVAVLVQAEGLRAPAIEQLLRSAAVPPAAPSAVSAPSAARTRLQQLEPPQGAQQAGADDAAAQSAACQEASSVAVTMRLGSGWRQGPDFAVDVNLDFTNAGAYQQSAPAIPQLHLLVGSLRPGRFIASGAWQEGQPRPMHYCCDRCSRRWCAVGGEHDLPKHDGRRQKLELRGDM